MLLTLALVIKLTDTNMMNVMCYTDITGPLRRNGIYVYHLRQYSGNLYIVHTCLCVLYMILAVNVVDSGNDIGW